MTEPIALPIEQMLRDAQVAWATHTGDHDGHPDLLGDLSLHVAALVAELRKASNACAHAHQHLDTYGVVSGPHIERELESQDRAFDLLRPFTHPVGHGWVAVYPELDKETS